MTCSCHVAPVVSMSRELIQIIGSFLYLDRVALEDALADVRESTIDPLALRCWISDDTLLAVELTLPMFADHERAFCLCDALAQRAVIAETNVRAHTF